MRISLIALSIISFYLGLNSGSSRRSGKENRKGAEFEPKVFQILEIAKFKNKCNHGGIDVLFSFHGVSNDCICGGHVSSRPFTNMNIGCVDVAENGQEDYNTTLLLNTSHRYQEDDKSMPPDDKCLQHVNDILSWEWGTLGNHTVCGRFVEQSLMIERTKFMELLNQPNVSLPVQNETISEFYLRLMCHYGPHSNNIQKMLRLFFEFHTKFLKLPRLLSLNEGKVLATKYFTYKHSNLPSMKIDIDEESPLRGSNSKLVEFIEKIRPSKGINSTCQVDIAYVYLLTSFDTEEQTLVKLFISTIQINCSIFIFHLDKTSNDFEKLQKFAKGYNRLQNTKKMIVIKRSHSLYCHWADPSLVFAELMGWIYATQSLFPWDYLINLSPHDMPLYPSVVNQTLQDYLESNYGRSFTRVGAHPDRYHDSFRWIKSCVDEITCCDMRWDNNKRKAHHVWRRMGKGFRVGEKHPYSQWHIFHRGLVEAVLMTGNAMEALLSIQFVNMIDEAYWVYMAQSFLHDVPLALDGSGFQRITPPVPKKIEGIPRMAVTKHSFAWIEERQKNKEKPLLFVRKVYTPYLCDFVSQFWNFKKNCSSDGYWLKEHKYEFI